MEQEWSFGLIVLNSVIGVLVGIPTYLLVCNADKIKDWVILNKKTVTNTSFLKIHPSSMKDKDFWVAGWIQATGYIQWKLIGGKKWPGDGRIVLVFEDIDKSYKIFERINENNWASVRKPNKGEYSGKSCIGDWTLLCKLESLYKERFTNQNEEWGSDYWRYLDNAKV
jgi:hypothetical protein